MAQGDPTRRVHSPIWEAMTVAQRDEFRALVAKPETRIEDAVNWCVERDLAASQSGVYRLMRRLSTEAACDRIREGREAAAEIIAAATSESGEIAGGESATMAVGNQLMLDYLLGRPELSKPSEVNALANVMRALARAKAVEIQRYREQVKQRAREAAENVGVLGKRRKLDAATIREIRESILGIA